MSGSVGNHDLIVVDVRDTGEIANTGIVESAIHLPISSPRFQHDVIQLANRYPAAEYAVYCRSGARSQRAVNFMRSMGLNARNYGSYQVAANQLGRMLVRN